MCASSAPAMAMHNTHKSIEGFARARFNHALMRGWPLHVSTKTLILKAYDGYLQDIYEEKSKNHSTRRS